MIEEYLINHCSPTLASIKTANLINVPFDSFEQLKASVERMNDILAAKGVKLLILKRSEKTALVYVVRLKLLERDLQRDGVADFLLDYGYMSSDADYCLSRLKMRLNGCDSFPHEIGIFLGYPLGDVIGFIENAGQNSLCSGCWKVYCNECEAMKTFSKYEHCKKIYNKLWLQGRSIARLAVAVQKG